ncbi:GNAT family N-acetyltransferase [Herbiconiux sp. CPCC 203407]|uniref:GNAT family N-acetyltransferase n=1 Tax=Herbiconiux oxytropis TaxID=2970915 RepID=A0AA42BWP8_9MICO|nr:GNAT family N-acetyltransferase [Herbiconiux oxytropis]MCS5723975.1 GNAT family N-acetyltransferase [Herbiconiux oxytropis]MCS5726818.1 GNAT family N-acetyltransferase [Herbiconiux oxytropis]
MTPEPASFTVRPYRPEDRAAVERICLETGDAGRDATPLHPDPRELTHRWATPYLLLEPEHAFVAERHGVVVGYVLGTADTRAYVADFVRADWADAAGGSPLDDPARREHAAHMLPVECDDYPAHLHIDLGEGARGGGLGRRLIDRFVEGLPPGTGVHVVVDPENAGALAFYPRIGFERLRQSAEGVVFGLSAPQRE